MLSISRMLMSLGNRLQQTALHIYQKADYILYPPIWKISKSKEEKYQQKILEKTMLVIQQKKQKSTAHSK